MTAWHDYAPAQL